MTCQNQCCYFANLFRLPTLVSTTRKIWYTGAGNAFNRDIVNNFCTTYRLQHGTCTNIPPGRKWNVAVCLFCILGIPWDSVFFHINWGYWFCKFLRPAGGLFFLLFLAQRQANFQKKRYPPVGPFFNWICLCLQRRWNFTRWFLLCHILATSVPRSENRSERSACMQGTSSSPPTPTHQLRSITHVCKWKEHHHPHPPPPISCVASHMCACARNLIIPTAPTHQLRIITHVCKCKEHHHHHHHHPHPPPPISCVAWHMCAPALEKTTTACWDQHL